MGKRQGWIRLAAFSLAWGLFLVGGAPKAGEPGTERELLRLYSIAQGDIDLRALALQYSQNPSDRALEERVLLKMPLSPLDMFRLRMETNHHEYFIPAQVQFLDHRWRSLHDQLPARTYPGSEDLPECPANDRAPEAAVVSTNRNVAATSTPAPTEYDGEIQLAVNPNNPNQMVVGSNHMDQGTGGCLVQGIGYTSNGGATWNFTCAPGFSAYGLSCGGGSIAFGSDPAVYWDAAGNVYFNHMLLCCDLLCAFGFGNPKSSIVTAYSTNGGASWAARGVVSNHLSTSNMDDKNFYIVDTNPSSPYYNRHYTIWDIDNVEQVATSTNGGINWTQVTLPAITGDSDLGGEMAVGNDGTLHIIFDSLTCSGSTCSAERTWYTRSTDGGATFLTPVLIRNSRLVSFSNANKPPVQESRGINPFGAIDRDNNLASPYYGTLYIIGTDNPAGGDATNANIYSWRSIDNGATWLGPTQVNDDATATSQFHAFLAVDPNDGTVATAWYDARNDTTNNRNVDIYMSRSSDGGASWEPNIKVTQPSLEFANADITYTCENQTGNTNANANQFGEYLGVCANDRTAYIAWGDSRTFFPANTTNAQKENVAHASVVFCSAPTATGAPSLAASCQGSTSKITVGWTAPSGWGTNATGGTYSVERATVLAGPYTTVASGLSTLTYADTTVTGGTTYFYRVIAKNNCPGTTLTPMSATSSSNGTVASTCGASSPPGTPGPVTVTKFGSALRLAWSAVGGTCGGTTYSIYQGNLPLGSYSHASIACSLAGTTYDVTPVPLGPVYYLVTAQSSTEEGSYGTQRTNAGGSLEIPAAAAPCNARALNTSACP